MARDFLHDLITAAVSASMESPSALWRFECAMRREHGGRRYYIRATAPQTAADAPESPPRHAAVPGGVDVR
jgi:hypothetical protein